MAVIGLLTNFASSLERGAAAIERGAMRFENWVQSKLD